MLLTENLRKLRESNSLTCLQLANLLGITKSGYSKYENGKRSLPLGFLMKLAKFYGVTTDYLLGMDEYEPTFYEKAPRKK